MLLLLSGCATGSGAKWYAPASWFSHAPAENADKAATKEEGARHAVVKEAQRTAHQTQVAIASAPASRPVATAADFNASTVALLDQAEGPLPVGEIEALKRTVAGLLSENAKVREDAEKVRANEREQASSAAERLAKAERASEQATAALRAAFERENALANELRAQRALVWIVGGIGVLLGLGWLYVQFALGGVPVAIGKAMRDLKATHPDIAKQVAPFYTKYLNRNEQKIIESNAQ